MLIVVTYDIPDDRRRTKLAHALKDFGERVQYSAFECLLEADQVEKLSLRITCLISPEVDSVCLYRFCADCGERTQVLGLGKLSEDPDVYLLWGRIQHLEDEGCLYTWELCSLTTRSKRHV